MKGGARSSPGIEHILAIGTEVVNGNIQIDDQNMNDDEDSGFRIEIANEKHMHFSSLISQTMEESARTRGTGIARRSLDTIKYYMLRAMQLLLHQNGKWAGFCYLSEWDNGRFVSNSGLTYNKPDLPIIRKLIAECSVFYQSINKN